MRRCIAQLSPGAQWMIQGCTLALEETADRGAAGEHTDHGNETMYTWLVLAESVCRPSLGEDAEADGMTAPDRSVTNPLAAAAVRVLKLTSEKRCQSAGIRLLALLAAHQPSEVGAPGCVMDLFAGLAESAVAMGGHLISELNSLEQHDGPLAGAYRSELTQMLCQTLLHPDTRTMYYTNDLKVQAHPQASPAPASLPPTYPVSGRPCPCLPALA